MEHLVHHDRNWGDGTYSSNPFDQIEAALFRQRDELPPEAVLQTRAILAVGRELRALRQGSEHA